MKPTKSIQELLEDKLIEEILKTLLRTFRLEENFSTLAKRLDTSRPTLKSRIEDLEKYNIIVKHGVKVRLSLDEATFTTINQLLPIKQNTKNFYKESLQRELVRRYITNHKDQNNFFKIRPSDNFDIKESVYPSVSISNQLEITEASTSFYNLFKKDVPRSKNKKYILNFFKNINIYLYDFDNDIIKNKLVYNELYSKLMEKSSVKIDACYIRQDKSKVFLSILIVMQSNFLGLQAIMEDITERVKQNRIRLRLTHRFYHLVSQVDTISDELRDMDIENKRFKELTTQLDKLSSFDYLDNLYVADSPTTMVPYRDFKLDANLESIINQLKFLHNIPQKNLTFKTYEKEIIKIPTSYDIYLYEGLYLLIHNLITLNNKSCECMIKTYIRKEIIHIDILFSQNINSKVENLTNKLQSEIDKFTEIKDNHLDIRYFIDKLPRESLLDLTIGTYFQEIKINKKKNNIVFIFKDTN